MLAQCKCLLRELEGFGLLTFKRITVSGIPRGTGSRKFYSKNTDMQGMSDLLVFLPGGKTLHVECKATKGKLSPDQKAWEATLTRYGHPYAVVRHPHDLQRLLMVYGVQHWSLG